MANEGTKISLISGTLENETVAELVEKFTSIEIEQHCYLWVSRVPSYNNIADPPSPGDLFIFGQQPSEHVSDKAGGLVRTVLHQISIGGNG